MTYTDTQTHANTKQAHINTQADTYKHTHRHTLHRQTDKQTNTQNHIQIHTQTRKHTDTKTTHGFIIAPGLLTRALSRIFNRVQKGSCSWGRALPLSVRRGTWLEDPTECWKEEQGEFPQPEQSCNKMTNCPCLHRTEEALCSYKCQFKNREHPVQMGKASLLREKLASSGERLSTVLRS